MPALRLRQLRFLHELNQANLRRVVSIFGLRLVLRDHARPRLQHRRRMHVSLRIEELRHPDFFPQNPCYLRHFPLRPSLALSYWLGSFGLTPWLFKYSRRFFSFLNMPHALAARNRRKAPNPTNLLFLETCSSI